MKAVLISIRPEWSRLILNREKTIEVRKTRPKLETPFKCYIYCTQGSEKLNVCNIVRTLYEANGTVFGEFVCDRITEIHLTDEGYDFDVPKMTCLKYEEMEAYLGRKNGYGWHISELVIYDEPKKLSEFTPCCKFMLDEKQCDYRKVKCLNQQDSFMEEDGCNCLNFVRRPSMSWCYVESLEGGTDNA